MCRYQAQYQARYRPGTSTYRHVYRGVIIGSRKGLTQNAHFNLRFFNMFNTFNMFNMAGLRVYHFMIESSL